MRLISAFAIGLSLMLPTMIGSADTATPTATPTVTATITPTLDLYAYATLPASGRAVAIVYTITAGEIFTGLTQLIVIALLFLLVFLAMVRRNG